MKKVLKLSIAVSAMAASMAGAGEGSPGVKVCGVNDKASVLAVLEAAREAGSDNLVVGLLLGTTHFSRERVSPEQAAELVRHIRSLSYSMGVRVRIACVTHIKESDALARLVSQVSSVALEGENGLLALEKRTKEEFHYPDADRLSAPPVFDFVQIHDDMPLPEMERVKSAFPSVKLIKAFHVPASGTKADAAKLAAAAVALAAKPYVDALLLDSANPAADQIGGTGLTNDWGIARAVIEAVHSKTGKPVALAGGINPDNASAALEKTGADLLDANTGFRLDRPGGGWKQLSPNESAPKDAFAVLSVLKQTSRVKSSYAWRLFAK